MASRDVLRVAIGLGCAVCGIAFFGLPFHMVEKHAANPEISWSALRPSGPAPTIRRISLIRSGFGTGSRGISELPNELPMGEMDHSSSQRAEQFGSFETVAEMSGKKVTLSGFVVPIESDGQGNMTELLFVPFFGACIHVPPPPPNQVVYAHLKRAMQTPAAWDAYQLQGVLRTSKFDGAIASAAYSMADAELFEKAAD